MVAPPGHKKHEVGGYDARVVKAGADRHRIHLIKADGVTRRIKGTNAGAPVHALANSTPTHTHTHTHAHARVPLQKVPHEAVRVVAAEVVDFNWRGSGAIDGVAHPKLTLAVVAPGKGDAVFSQNDLHTAGKAEGEIKTEAGR